MSKANSIQWGYIKSAFINLIYGEYFTDALRNTLTIVIPVALLFFYNHEQAAIGVGLGSLLISLTDLPGNKGDKFKSAVTSVLIFYITSLLISICLGNTILMSLTIVILTFVYSMFAIFGTRMGLTGTMAIILFTFIIGLKPQDPLLFSGYVFLGGVWYYLISLTQIAIWPYRSLHQAIFECIESTSALLHSKSRSYDINVQLDECYRESITLHVKVSEKQELIRNLLLSDKSAMKPTNARGTRLLKVALNVIDLYEQVTAVHYDYAFVRKSLKDTGALQLIISLIEMLANELHQLSKTFLIPGKRKLQTQNLLAFDQELNRLKDLAVKSNETNAKLITRVVKNMEGILWHIQEIRSDEPVEKDFSGKGMKTEEYKHFLSPIFFNTASLKQFLSFQSPVFRFSLRLSILFLFAYLLMLAFPFGNYSYWMLLTIVIVAKPRFSLTLKRNIERLSGTFAGVIIGLLLLTFIRQESLLLVLSGILLLGFFTFNRIKYAVSVLCITTMVVLCLSIYSGNTGHIISERIYYTIIGCAIAFSAAYLFPVWEFRQLKSQLGNLLTANITYLKQVTNEMLGLENGVAESKLARKDAHLKLAKFSEALQYTRIEPYMKRVDLKGIYIIQTLCYRINALVSSLSLSAKGSIAQEMIKLNSDQALKNLNYCLSNMPSLDLKSLTTMPEGPNLQAEDRYEGTLLDQLKLLSTLTNELKRFYTKPQ